MHTVPNSYRVVVDLFSRHKHDTYLRWRISCRCSPLAFNRFLFALLSPLLEAESSLV
jgi:hypothetical protein